MISSVAISLDPTSRSLEKTRSRNAHQPSYPSLFPSPPFFSSLFVKRLCTRCKLDVCSSSITIFETMCLSIEIFKRCSLFLPLPVRSSTPLVAKFFPTVFGAETERESRRELLENRHAREIFCARKEVGGSFEAGKRLEAGRVARKSGGA